MTYFLRNGKSFMPVAEAELDVHKMLPVGNYVIKKNPQTDALYFQRVDEFSLPSRMYGNTVRHAERIVSTFNDRPKSTGVLLAGEKGSGKALRIDQKVYTESGEREIGSLSVGDKIYGADGKLTTVLGVYPQGIRNNMFAVTFNDGTQSMADGEHLWSVKQTTRSQTGFSKQTTRCVAGTRRVFTTDKILTTDQIYKALKNGVKHTIPLCDPIEFTESTVVTDRYTLGLLIGDGTLNHSTLFISSGDDSIIQHIRQSNTLVHASNYDYRFKDSKLLRDELTLLGLHNTHSNNKFIPDKLKYDSIDNRFALLQGLMDSDGTVCKRGSQTYTTVSPRLANDVVWLARSLGFRSSIQHTRHPTYTYKGEKKIGQLAYTIQLTGANNDKVFRLERKHNRIRRCSSSTKTIVDIQPIEPAEAVCILVDNDSHLFVTNDFTVTHNTLLASALSIKCAELGYPTIIVSQPWVGEAFNQLIQGIQQPAVVFFDEFEKTYDDKTQEQLLTLLDGTFPSKKLFVLTCNDSWRVNSHMTNRPGRIYYMLDFRGLTIEFIKEYCFDNLVATHYTESICKLSSLFDQFNFDMLKALVEEMNRYNESPLEVMELLNTKPRKGDDGKFSVLLFNAKNQKIKPYNNTYEGNPLANLNFEIMFRRSDAEIAVESPVPEVRATWSPGSVAGSLAGSIDDYDSEPEVDDDILGGNSTWVTLHFVASNLTEFNAAAGTLTYVNVQGFRVVFTRLKPVYANFTGLLA